MANNEIRFGVKFDMDQTSLNQIKASLKELESMTNEDLKIFNPQATNQDLEKIKAAVKDVETAFDKSFNKDLGTLNVAKFNQAIKQTESGITGIYKSLTSAGSAGQNAFRNMTTQVLTTNLQLKESHSLLKKMRETMANTIKWNLASGAMNMFTGRVQEAYGYVKHLDSSLNDIRIVTGQNAEEMAKFAQQANKAAQALGRTTTDYTEASLIYYQQGLSDAEVKAKTETTLKAANITGQSAQAVSEQLTAVWNGYKVDAAEAELYVDKLQAVAATTASDLQELSTGMSKVASAANLMGVDMDSLNAQLATIISVTRQAPESVGTALKTFYARMGDIEAGLDTETTLGEYTSQMAEMGVNVLEANGKLRDMGDVIEEIGGKWNTMSKEQQLSLSQTMAGTRQYNNLLALFDNWDMYTKALNTSETATGTLQNAQDTYMESTEAHLAALKTEWEDLYDSLLDPESINSVADALKGLVGFLTNFVDSIGGGKGALLALGAIGTRVFSKDIASGLVTTINNFRIAKDNAAQLQAEMAILSNFENADVKDVRTQRLIEMKREQINLSKVLTDEEKNITNEYIRQQNELYKEQDILKQRADQAKDVYKRMRGDNENFDIDDEESRNKAIEDLQDSQSDFNDETNSNNKANKETLERVPQQIEAISAAQEKYNEALLNSAHANEALEAAVKKADEAVDGQTQASQQAEAAFKAAEAAEEELANAEKVLAENSYKAQDAVITQIHGMETLIHSGKLSKKQIEELQNAKEKLAKATQDGNKVDLKNSQTLDALRQASKAYAKVTKEVQGEIKAAIETLKNHGKATEDNVNKVNTLEQTWRQAIKNINLRNTITQTINLAGQVGQVASAMSTIKKLPSIWNDDDLTTGEKFLQTLTNIGFTLPMLASGFSGMANTLKSTATGTAALTAAKKAYFGTLVASAGAEANYNALLAQGLSVKSACLVALNAETLSEIQKTEVEKIAIAVKKGEMTQEEADIALKGILAGANLTVAGTLKAAAAAAKNFIASLGPIGWAIIGITAAVTILVPIVKALFKAFEAKSPEGKLKAAKERAKELNTVLQETKTSADNLRKSLEAYDKAEQALEGCTKGTEEFKKALQDANNEVLALMEKYPQLSSMMNEEGEFAITRGENGELKIADWAQEELLNDSIMSVSKAQAAAIEGNQAVRTADIEVKKSNLDLGGEYANQALENMMKQHPGGFTSEEYKTELTKIYKAAGYEIGVVSDSINGFTKAVEGKMGDINDLQAAIDANTRATEIENETIAASALANNDRIQNSGMAEEITKASGDIYSVLRDQAMEDLKDEGWGTKGISKLDGANGEAKEIWNEYLKAANLENAGYTLKDTTGTDKNRKFVYTDESGDKKDISLDAMRETVAAARAMEQLGASAEALMNKLIELEASAEIADKALRDMLVDKNLEGITEEEFEEYKNKLSGENGEITEASVEAYLDEKFGDGEDDKISDKTAQKYGYETADLMVQAFMDGVTDYETAIGDLREGLLGPVKEVFDGLDLEGFTLKGQQAVANVLQDAFANGGEEGLERLQNLFNNVDMSPEEMELFASTLEGIDWNSMDASTLAKTLEGAGIQAQFTVGALNTLISTMSDSRMTKSFDTLAQDFAKIQEVAGDLHLGDSISAEEFNVLGDEFRQYFTLMADGTYKLTHNAEEFQKSIQEKSVKGFVDNIDKLEEKNKNLEKIKNYDFNDLTQTQAVENTEEGGLPYIYNEGDVNKQLEVLEVMGYDAEQLAAWRDDLADGNTSSAALQNIADAVAEYRGELENLDEAIIQNKDNILQQEIAIATSYTSLDELKAAYEEGQFSAQAYSEAVLQLQESQSMEGLDTEEMDDYADHLMDVAKNSDLVSSELATNEKAANSVAKATMRLNKGIDSLENNFKDWSDVIKKSDKTSQEYSEAMNGMKDAMSDVLGTSEDFLTDDFIVENLEDIEKAATGDEEAIRNLQAALSKDIICQIKGVSNFDDINTQIQEMHNELWDLSDQNIEVGATLETGDFFDAAQGLVDAAGMSVDEAQSYFNSLGYEPEFVMENKTVTAPLYGTRVYTDDIVMGELEDGTKYVQEMQTHEESVYEDEKPQNFVVPAMSADGKTPQIKSLTRVNNGGSLGNKSSSNPGGKKSGGGGGGGSKGSKKDKFKGRDRYAAVNNSLKDINNELERQASLSDKLTGNEKLDSLQKQLTIMQKQTDTQGEKLRLLREERKELQDKLKDKGFTFDKSGDMKNYDSLLKTKEQAVNDAIDRYNELVEQGVTDESLTAAEEAVENATKEFESLKEDADRYNEVILDEIEGILQEIQAGFEEQISLKIQELELRAEMELRINYENEYEKIGNGLKKINNDLEESADIYERLTTQQEKISNIRKRERLEQQQRNKIRKQETLLGQEKDDIETFLENEGVTLKNGSYYSSLKKKEGKVETAENEMLTKKEAYENLLLDEKATEKQIKDALDAYEKAYVDWGYERDAYSVLKEKADRYNEILLEEIPDLEQQIQESLDEQTELKVLKVQAKLEISEDFDIDLENIEGKISKIANDLEKSERAMEKLTGQDKIAAMNTQLTLLQEQASLEQEKLTTLKNQKAEIETNLKKVELTKGADGDYTDEWKAKKGTAIENAKTKLKESEDARDALEAEVQSLEEQIKDKEDAIEEEKDKKKKKQLEKELKTLKTNLKTEQDNLSKAQKQADDDEVAFRAAEGEYEAIKEAIDAYEDLVYNAIPDAENAIQDALDQSVEIKLAQQELTLQIRLDFKNARKELNEFKKEILDDDNLSGLSEANQTILDEYFGITPKEGEDQTGKRGYIELQKEKYKNALKAYNTIVGGGTDDTYGDNAAKALEDLTAAKDELKNLYSEVNALVEENHQNYLKGIDEADKAFTEHLEKYNDLTSSIQYQLDLVNLMKNAMKNENRILANQQTAYEKIHEINKSRRADIEKEIEYWESQKAGVAEGSEEWDKITTNLENAQKELENVTKSSIENVNKIYETSKKLASLRVDNILFGKDLDSNFDFNEEKQNWEKLSNWRKKYLDDVNETFKKDEFIQKVNDAIENTDNLAIQERLNKLKEQELKLLEEKGKITQKDIDRMNKMLEIEQKKIALEEAQKNKSTMRLRRDANGNYSYQYVADQDAINKAEQELKKAQNEAYNTAKNNYGDSKTNLEKLINDFQKELEKAETEEDFNQIKSNYQEFFTDAISDYETNLANYRKELENQGKSEDEINQLIAEAFPQGELLEDFIKNFQTPQAFSEDGKIIIREGFDVLFEQVSQPYLDALKERIKGYEEATGESNVNGQLNTLTHLSNIVENTTTELATSMEDLIETQTDTLKSLKEIFNDSNTKLATLSDSVIKALEWYATLMQKQDNNNQSINVGDMEGFDTGGYTGGWNSSEGRLAILHQKELVLNQEDTLNLLAAMEELKEIETLGKIKNNIMDSNLLIKYKDTMDNVQKELEAATNNLISQKLTMTLNLEDFSDKLETLVQDRASLLSMTSSEFEKAFKNVITDTKTQNFKQNVQINAEFPGVNNSEEIERAFNSLTSKAQRYIIDETAI